LPWCEAGTALVSRNRLTSPVHPGSESRAKVHWGCLGTWEIPPLVRLCPGWTTG